MLDLFYTMAMENLLIIICFIVMLVHLSAGEIEIAVLAGQNTTLPCIFEGIPSHVTWLKGDEPPGEPFAKYVDNMIIYRETVDKDRYRMQKNSSFSLTITDVEIADAGRYRCAVTINGANFPSPYHLEVLDALFTSVTIPALHGSTPTTPASTQTVTTTSTDRRNQTVDDTGSGTSLAAKLGIAFGVIFGVVIIVVALVIIAVYRKRIEEAIKQRRSRRTRNGNTSPQLSPNKDEKENEAVNETLMTTVC